MTNEIIAAVKFETEIVKAVARALFVSAYADYNEEIGKGIPVGEDWAKHSPLTPPQALFDAYRLIGAFEQLNGASLIAMFNQACISESVNIQAVPKKFALEYGYCLAMSSLGHGVSWTDNHNEYSIGGRDIAYPHIENNDYGFVYPEHESSEELTG